MRNLFLLFTTIVIYKTANSSPTAISNFVNFDTKFSCIVAASNNEKVHIGSATTEFLSINTLIENSGLILLITKSGEYETIFVYNDIGIYHPTLNKTNELYLATNTNEAAETFGFIHFENESNGKFNLNVTISKNKLLQGLNDKVVSVPVRIDHYELICTLH